MAATSSRAPVSFVNHCESVALPPVAETRARYARELDDLEKYRRLLNYVSAAQLYLQSNELLREPLRAEHVKERLLGHFGTCPGLVLVQAHCERLIKRDNLQMILVVGPGHGAPGVLANLWAEGSLGEFYPDCGLSLEGAAALIRKFSWPGGFPSHVNAETPGSIHEGGELGYALAVAFGAVMDDPDLIVPCIVGDGEAETGPTATAWHSTKYLDPAESGAVLPILHVNGYKIAEPTIFGAMSNEELTALFTGYGYQVKIVDGFGGMEGPLNWDRMDLDADMLTSMEWALTQIRAIQHAARTGKPIDKPRWPMLILRSPKGWTGIREVDGQPIEGSYRSHQVPVGDCKTNPAHLKVVEDWLRSYRPEELFEVRDGVWTMKSFLQNFCPSGALRFGCNPRITKWRCDGTWGTCIKALDLPELRDFQVPVNEDLRDRTHSGIVNESSTRALGKFLREVVRRNPKTFRIFSPDELVSNKLNAVFDVTHRNFQWPHGKSDEDIQAHKGGRVIEILSEHTCQGWLQGYSLTGRYGLFPTYEAFLGIIATMADQYAKFVKMAEEMPWRDVFPSLIYLETSTLWRQEHNGFSHQNPGFINSVINKKASFARVFLPPDANTLVCTMRHCLTSSNKCCLVVAPKHDMPQWLSMAEAVDHCRAGAGCFKFCSTENGANPDVVLCGIGGEVTVEVVAAARILRTLLPQLRVRVVNVTDAMILALESEHPHGLSEAQFTALFTADRHVIINFHGYPSAIKSLLFHRHTSRFTVRGYQEEGTTTTPFDMMVLNGTDRFALAIEAIEHAIKVNRTIECDALACISHMRFLLRSHHDFIREYGVDSDTILAYPDRNERPGSIQLDLPAPTGLSAVHNAPAGRH